MRDIETLKAEREAKAKQVELMGYDPNGGAGQAHGNRRVFILLRQIEDLDAEIHRIIKER